MVCKIELSVIQELEHVLLPLDNGLLLFVSKS